MQAIWKTYQKEILFGILVLVILLVFRFYQNRLVRQLEVPTDDQKPAPRPGFNARAEAKMVYDELSGWNVALDRRAETLAYIVQYSDNELIEVHNAYLELYAKAKKKTLAELIRGEWIWTPGEYFGPASKNRNKILRRLRDMGAA